MAESTTTPDQPVDVPGEWRNLGFSGLFHFTVALADDADAEEHAAKLPATVPFGTNSSMLALSVDVEARTVLVVRADYAAVLDVVLGRRF